MGKTGMNPALLEFVCAPFCDGWGKEGAVQRLVRTSTGHHPQQDTHLQVCLLEGTGLLEEGAQVDLC